MKAPFWGSDGEEDQPDMEFHVPGERLEDDESLKMHVLGVHSLFSKYLVIVMSFKEVFFKFTVVGVFRQTPHQGTSKPTSANVWRCCRRATFHPETSRCCGWSLANATRELRIFAQQWACCCMTSISVGTVFRAQCYSRYITFWRRYKTVWCNTLRFLAPSSHATCDVCLDFKMKFRRSFEPWRKGRAFLVCDCQVLRLN